MFLSLNTPGQKEHFLPTFCAKFGQKQEKNYYSKMVIETDKFKKIKSVQN